MFKTLGTKNLDNILQFTEEDDFSYFCKYDELTGVVAIPDTYMPAIEESSYVSRSQVFDMQKN